MLVGIQQHQLLFVSVHSQGHPGEFLADFLSVTVFTGSAKMLFACSDFYIDYRFVLMFYGH
jgi:hypothetical protein